MPFRKIFTLSTLLLLATSLLFATDLLNQKYHGTYRKTSKTAIVRNNNGNVAPVQTFPSLKSLKNTLGDDTTMRNKYPDLSNKQSNALRKPEELRNVEVVAWLYDAKHQSDNDFHIVLGSTAIRSTALFMNTEIAGLPLAPGDDQDRLKAARQQFLTIIPSGRYTTEHTESPIKVKVRGSVIFDGDHQPGCLKCPGPGYAKPKSVWEIHPITSIEVVNP